MTQHERGGVLYALAGFALLSCGDAVIKSIGGEWPATAIAALRYAIGATGLSLLLLLRQGRAGFSMPRPGVQILRGFGVGMATIGFFAAVSIMPLAVATAILFTSPVLTSVLAAIFLGEPARRETWIATIVAFAGVLIVLRPNIAELGWGAVLPLLAALGTSLLVLGNRISAGLSTPLAMQVNVAAVASAFLLSAALLGHVSGIDALEIGVPHWSIAARCAVVAVTASCAHWLVYLGTTRAGAATIAPMTYVQMLVATALGWIFFADVPDLLTLVGALIIIGSGLYLWRSRSVAEPAVSE